ncbi:MAG: hypothetical protein IK143_04940 [Bacteroidales bacterium]|nr:hypothetical protein [Bacteroidales bacterium]
MRTKVVNILLVSALALVAIACHKDKKETITIREINSWKIEYLGKGTVEESGQVFTCEKFRTSGTGSIYHSLYVVKAGVVNTDAQILSAMQEDLAYYEDLVRKGRARRVTDLLSNADPDINTDYDALSEGIYDAFIFGYNSRGTYTGDFAKITFTVQASAGIASYADWLGVWSSGNAFDFEIAADEQGINYKIYGWQGFSREYAALADYDDQTGNLRIFGTDYGDYTDDGGTFHLLFTGDVKNGDELKSVEGTNDQLLATAILSDDGYSATIRGAQVTLTGETQPRTYCMIEYLFFAKDGSGEIFPLEKQAPDLPATITFKAESKASSLMANTSRSHAPARKAVKADKNNDTRNTAATKAATGKTRIRKTVTR